MFTDQQIADWRDNQLHDYLKSLEDDNCVELIKCAGCSDEVEETEMGCWNQQNARKNKTSSYWFS